MTYMWSFCWKAFIKIDYDEIDPCVDSQPRLSQKDNCNRRGWENNLVVGDSVSVFPLFHGINLHKVSTSFTTSWIKFILTKEKKRQDKTRQGAWWLYSCRQDSPAKIYYFPSLYKYRKVKSPFNCYRALFFFIIYWSSENWFNFSLLCNSRYC